MLNTSSFCRSFTVFEFWMRALKFILLMVKKQMEKVRETNTVLNAAVPLTLLNFLNRML